MPGLAQLMPRILLKCRKPAFEANEDQVFQVFAPAFTFIFFKLTFPP
jgi:hypothetical protein